MTLRTAPLVLVVVSFAACSSPPSHAVVTEAAPVPATLSRVEQADVPSLFEAGGVIRARATATIAARIMAPIMEVRVRPGDRVGKGQVLAILDGRDLKAQSVRAHAGLDAARETAKAADASAVGAAASLILATATHERIQRLYDRRSATAQELDAAVAALHGADAAVAGAEAHRREAAAGLAAATAAQDAADVSAGFATVTAPFDGLVTERMVDPGSIASPGQPLLVLEDVAGYRLEARLDESRAAQVTVGATADVRLDAAADDRWLPGRVAELARVDANAHSFLVKIDIPSAPSLETGLFGRARFAGRSRRALAAPASAVVRRGQLTFVFVGADGHARMRAVTVAPIAGDRVELLAGVQAGESVVASPAAALTDGARITASTANAAPAGEPGSAR